MNRFELYDASQQMITEFLEAIKLDMLDYMQAENRNATGKSAASLTVKATPKTGSLTGNAGIEYVFRGRGPGKMPPLSAIIDWCNARGIPRGAAWSIARKIAAAGTQLHRQGRNVLNEIITQERIDGFIKEIIITFTTQLKTDIKSLVAA